MFKNLFKSKKCGDTQLHSPVTGMMMDMSDVDDPLFSQKLMGDGYAVYPSNGEITSPVHGKIVSIFPTKHAIGILSDNEDEIILHIGINTVDLKGIPFQLFVKEGDSVDPTTHLVDMDLTYLKEKGVNPTVIVVLANIKNDASIEVFEHHEVTSQQKIGQLVS